MNIRNIFENRRKLSSSQLGRWFFSLENLLSSGIPLMQALESIGRSFPNNAAAEEIREHISQGDSLRTAMEKTGAFDSFALTIIESGEQSGELQSALETLRSFYMQRESFRRQLIQAMYYPLLVLGCLFFLMIFLVFYFVPAIAALWGPAIALSQQRSAILVRGILLLREYFLPIGYTLILLLLFLLKVLQFFMQERGGYPAAYALPFIGKLLQKQKLGEILWSLGTMLGCGLDILRSLEVISGNQRNPRIREQIRELMRLLSEGQTLEESLSCLDLEDGDLRYFIALGEESGDLAGKIDYLAQRYRAEIERDYRLLLSMVQPAVVLMLTAAVGILMIGVVLPLLDSGMLYSI